ncbi:type VI secretion system protein ImpG [Geomonas limicola]|uniref:Type VI secretion system protein ImpG n=1 Tax=Geomonas limicola TaxID=2740186 RepID=A0A6V8NAA8_9BACT|nr:type VI secretion system baseplate subunit TssF [Geomonas limicola]GFO69528.1 type VI secretion system protein ImpG [Geomonas limicola]
MLEILYQEELARLKDLAAEFAEAHPALAPLLGGTAADPDVERLFQGVALQFAQLRQKLEDDVPEFTHALARQLCPQLLRPVPATTIVAFAPKASLSGTRTVKAGTELDSVPVEGTSCRFRSCADVELHPLELLDAAYVQSPGAPPAISLTFALTGCSLEQWQPDSLRLFLAEEYPVAAELFFVLNRQVRRVLIAPERGGETLELHPDCLIPASFNDAEPMLPYPATAFPGYRQLQEFFALPSRFLFLDLTGWRGWRNRGSGTRFTVRFELASAIPASLRVRPESFALYATPAVNLFACDAVPFLLDHRSDRYAVHPDGLPRGHAQVFSVDRVQGFGHGTGRRRRYRPVEAFASADGSQPSFGTTAALAPLGGELEVSLTFNHAPDGLWQEGETISVALTCTSGRLPELLSLGDVCRATSSSPEWASFRNITPVRPGVLPCLGNHLLWRLVAHQSLSLGSLLDAEALRELLNVYLFEETCGGLPVMAHRKRIAGIEQVVATAADRVVRGIAIRGTEICLRVNGGNFAGVGDLFVFGSVLDAFLAGIAALNSYTCLTVHDTSTGEVMAWTPRLGDQPLL